MIVCIDDRTFPIKYYMKQLEATGFTTTHLSDPDSALQFVEEQVKNNKNIEAILLDIRMPPGARYRSINTGSGLETGVLLYADLRKLCPQVPIIVLTDFDKDWYQRMKRMMDPEGPLFKVAPKGDVGPRDLAKIVQRMVQESRP